MFNAWPTAFIPSLQDADHSPASAPAELTRAQLKELRPLGHEIRLWAEAAALLTGRLARGKYSADLSHFLQTWLPKNPPVMPAGAFTLLLTETARGWRLTSSSLSWLNEPAWTALLRLPALRSAWISDLRASHFEHLMQLLPEAWFMDAAQIPPGAVIPGLEIPAWPHLILHHGSRRCFRIGNSTLKADQPTSHWQQEITTALNVGGQICLEEQEGTSWLLARYQQNQKELTLSAAWTSA